MTKKLSNFWNSNWDTFLGLVAIFAIVIQLPVFFIENRSEEIEILLFADNVICFFFFCDFLIKLIRVENKLDYLRWGWIDLLSSIPTIGIFRFFRIFRIINFHFIDFRGYCYSRDRSWTCRQ